MHTDPLEELLAQMPSDTASSSEIEAYMEKVMATKGGAEMIQSFAQKIASGGELDQMLKEDDARYPKPQSKVRIIFRVELVGTQPLVWRRLSLPSDASFFDLHCAIQDSFGWEGKNFHRFEIWEEGELELTFSLDEEADGDAEDYCEVSHQMIDLFRENVSEFRYLYDFKDCWLHRVVVENLREDESGECVPQLHDGQAHGPPEGCGGVVGFQAFLAGGHPLCDSYEEEVMTEFREGQPDFEKVIFRDPARVLSQISFSKKGE